MQRPSGPSASDSSSDSSSSSSSDSDSSDSSSSDSGGSDARQREKSHKRREKGRKKKRREEARKEAQEQGWEAGEIETKEGEGDEERVLASMFSGAVNFHDHREEDKRKGKKFQLDFKTDDERRAFLVKPLRRDEKIECRIRRTKMGLLNKFPLYELYLDKSMKCGEELLVVGKRAMGARTSNYRIALTRHELDPSKIGYLGKVRSNFLGTEFILYDNGMAPEKVKNQVDSQRPVRTELGAVLYGRNLVADKPREMTVILPPDERKTGEGTIGIMARYKRDAKGFFHLHQKQPQWNRKVKCYVLNFHGRVTKRSVKNFQLVYRGMGGEEDEYMMSQPQTEELLSLQFGKIADHSFTMDVRWPLSPLQAFAICLSSFDPKMACE